MNKLWKYVIIRVLIMILYLLVHQGNIDLRGSIWFVIFAMMYIPSAPLAYYFLNRPYDSKQQLLVLASFFLVELGVSYFMFTSGSNIKADSLYALSGLVALLLAKFIR